MAGSLFATFSHDGRGKPKNMSFNAYYKAVILWGEPADTKKTPSLWGPAHKFDTQQATVITRKKPSAFSYHTGSNKFNSLVTSHWVTMGHGTPQGTELQLRPQLCCRLQPLLVSSHESDQADRGGVLNFDGSGDWQQKARREWGRGLTHPKVEKINLETPKSPITFVFANI